MLDTLAGRNSVNGGTEKIAPATVAVSVDNLREYMRCLLVAAGCNARNATGAAEGFLYADLSGVGLQGLDHMPTLLDALRDGRVDGNGAPHVAHERAGTALVDGARAPGHVGANFAVEVAIGKAREAGSCTVALTNSFDLFMLGRCTQQIAAAGLVGIAFSDAPPMVRPHGGKEARMGTNPFSIAVPTAGDPVVVDLATSALSASRVRQAMYHDQQVPEASGVDADGNPTTDPQAVRAGAIGPLGGHKGFGLSLCVALLSGSLTGSDTGSALRRTLGEDGRAPRKGHLFIAIDPTAFGEQDTFLHAATAYLEEVKSSELVDPDAPIRIPGERAAQTRREVLNSGQVPVFESVWERMASVARALGVTVPSAHPVNAR